MHSLVHHTHIVSNKSYSIPNDYSTLNRVFAFIRNQIGNQSQVLINGIDVIGNTYGSILSGSKYFVKYKSDSIYYFKGISDENGTANMAFFPTLQIGDSIKVEASGYEVLVLAVDSTILTTKKIEISMLKLQPTTTKIQYPSLKLVNQNPVTSISPIALEATGQNVLKYEINSPFNQDTLFVPLILNSNQFIANLDTGN